MSGRFQEFVWKEAIDGHGGVMVKGKDELQGTMGREDRLYISIRNGLCEQHRYGERVDMCTPSERQENAHKKKLITGH